MPVEVTKKPSVPRRVVVYHPVAYITRPILQRFILSGRARFPLNYMQQNGRICAITPEYLFFVALTVNPDFAESLVLSGIMDITTDTLVECLNVKNSLIIPPIRRMIDALAMLPRLEKSRAGITLFSCVDLYDDATKECNMEGDVDIIDTRQNLISLAEKMYLMRDTRRVR